MRHHQHEQQQREPVMALEQWRIQGSGAGSSRKGECSTRPLRHVAGTTERWLQRRYIAQSSRAAHPKHPRIEHQERWSD